MIVLSDPRSNQASLMVIEGGLTLITAAVAFGWPSLGSGFFERIEKVFVRLARRQNLAVTVVGFSAILLRLAILPVCPSPHPFLPERFQLSAGRGHLRFGKIDQSYARDVGSFRDHPRHHEADLYVDVLSRARAGHGGGEGS